MSAPTATTGMRPWQQEALAAWQAAGRRGIVEAVTGTGKTRVGIAAVEQCVAEGGRAVVLVPTVELQEQWARQLRSLLPHAQTALLGGGHRPFGAWDVVVAVINTASAPHSEGVLRGCTLLVADECHRYGAVGFATALRRTHRHRLGLTATLERQDDGIKRHLMPYFASLLLTYDYRRAVPEGTVAPFRVALVGVHLTPGERGTYEDLSTGIEKGVAALTPYIDPTQPFFPQVVRLARRDDRAGLTASSLLKLVSERRQLLGDCQAKHELVPSLAPVLDRSRSLVFTERVATAEAAARALRRCEVPAGAVHSDLPASDRHDLLRDFSTGRLRVLCAPRVLDEGIDVPEADLAVVLSGTRTRRQMVQRMGRVLRLKADGRSANFVLAFARETVEDPGSRAHDGFLTAIAAVASDRRDFDAAQGLDDVLQYLGGPLTLPPRAQKASSSPRPEVTSLQKRAELRTRLVAAQHERLRHLSVSVKSPDILVESQDMAGEVQ